MADPTRTPRSLTVHYLSPPAEGPVEIDTTLERSGRSMTFVTGRLRQGDRLLALAMAAFAAAHCRARVLRPAGPRTCHRPRS